MELILNGHLLHSYYARIQVLKIWSPRKLVDLENQNILNVFI